MSCDVGRKFTQYINLGSYVTVPAGVTLDNNPIAMQGPAGLICKKVLHTEVRISSPPSASGSRPLFVLSVGIQLFEFDTKFMTTSIHLVVSDDSVAHTPLMYSEERGDTCWGNGTRPIWLQGLPWWITPQWTSRLYQRMLPISPMWLIRDGLYC